MMEQLQLKGFRVHVDYSDDMLANLTEPFLQDNNVRFILQVQEDTNRILFSDRFGYLSQSEHLGVFNLYADLKQLMSDFASINVRSKRERINSIMSSVDN